MIISLHLDKCNNINCLNQDICYHNNKYFSNETFNVPKAKIYELLKNEDIIIYDALSKVHEYNIDLLHTYKNYNVTIEFGTLLESKLAGQTYKYKDNVFISCNENDITCNSFKPYNKIHLYKWDINDKSLEKLVNTVENTHFVFDRDSLNDSRLKIITEIYLKYMYQKETTNSIDSCIENLIINGECPYKNHNYIDITYDNTSRLCPFKKQGFPIKFEFNDIETCIKDIINNINHLDKNYKCSLIKYFKGK